MTITQLKYVITVAESNSMNEAAGKLFISQPSLSASIKELESETGIELFRRTNRGITITPDGKEFIGYAMQTVQQYELMEAKYVSKKELKKKKEEGKRGEGREIKHCGDVEVAQRAKTLAAETGDLSQFLGPM